MNPVYGTLGHDTIDGAYGTTDDEDYIRGFNGDDTIIALDGDDWIEGGEGADYIDGGLGDDFASYFNSNSGVSVNLVTGIGSGGEAEGDTLVSIEKLLGSSYDDVFHGNGKDNLISGDWGSDTIKGLGGADILSGGPGEDLLVGGEGADTLSGGDGIDTADYAESNDGIFISLKDNLALYGDAAGDVLTSVESLNGSAHGDGLLGNDGYNVLNGLGGKDTLKGFGGNDTLRGGAGEDWLLGGAGEDALHGGANADTFVWQSTGETGLAPANADRIADFSAAQGDRIDLSGIDADVYALGNQAFTFIGAAAFTLNLATPENTDVVPGEVRYYHFGGATYLQMQTGTSPDIEGLIRIDGIHTPEASWFVL